MKEHANGFRVLLILEVMLEILFQPIITAWEDYGRLLPAAIRS